jgi:leucyl aminopeptidase
MMKVSATSIPLTDLDVDLLLVPVAMEDLDAERAALVDALGPMAERAMADFGGGEAEVVLFYPDGARAQRAALIGLGAAAEVDAERLRQAAATGAGLAREREAQHVAVRMPAAGPSPEAAGQALTEGFLLAGYQFLRYKTDAPDYVEPDRLILHVDEDDRDARRGAERGRAVAEGVRTARDLVNLSPDDKTPTLLARTVEKLGKKHGFEVAVWDKALIEEEGMGGLLAVNRGSQEPPVFLELTWRPERAPNETPVILVGKGVVFDTGGLSIKSTKGGMDQMKADMAGAAAVIGAFEALARLDVPLYVVGLIPATDNRPGENAYVPGDVLRMHSGKTVEVLNTDAEGRLILADALSYATTYRPALVIDLATLTGGQVIALGSDTAALMTNDRDGAADRLAAMEAAGRRSGDWVHRMPMDAVYGKLLESDVADLKNVGGREASSITAAKFLEHFVAYPWMHLDIAGPAFLTSEKPYRPKGGTGFGVRLLIDFLRDYASPKKVR